jgi:hypothetical protein
LAAASSISADWPDAIGAVPGLWVSTDMVRQNALNYDHVPPFQLLKHRDQIGVVSMTLARRRKSRATHRRQRLLQFVETEPCVLGELPAHRLICDPLQSGSANGSSNTVAEFGDLSIE